MLNNLSFFAIQAALFIGSGSIRSDELSFLIRSKMDIGEFEPITFPEQPGAPVEIPRLHISTDNGYRFTMSKARIDIICEWPFGIDAKEEARFAENIRRLSDILSEKDFIFSRIGVVKSWFANQEKAALEIADLLLKVPSDNVTDVSFAITKRVQLREFECNSLFNFSNGVHQSGAPGAIVVRDVNTIVNEAKQIKCADVEGIFEAFNSEASSESIVKFAEGR